MNRREQNEVTQALKHALIGMLLAAVIYLARWRLGL